MPGDSWKVKTLIDCTLLGPLGTVAKSKGQFLTMKKNLYASNNITSKYIKQFNRITRRSMWIIILEDFTIHFFVIAKNKRKPNEHTFF